METIAVYWEKQIKVYSINEKPELALGILSLPSNQLSILGEHLAELQESIERFELVTINTKSERLEVHLVIENRFIEALNSAVQIFSKLCKKLEYTLIDSVEMLYLHGPHFQDRYGIAERAFTAFASRSVKLLLAGCAGTSMYLIVPFGQAGKCRDLIAKEYIIPTDT